MKTHRTKNPQETKEIGRQILKKSPHRVICLYGDLGAGKTTFVKGLGLSLGIPELKIKSPTFVTLHEHQGKKGKLYHFDLYRVLKNGTILEEVKEIFQRLDGVVVIEWADRIKKHLPKRRTDIYLEHKGATERMIKVKHI